MKWPSGQMHALDEDLGLRRPAAGRAVAGRPATGSGGRRRPGRRAVRRRHGRRTRRAGRSGTAPPAAAPSPTSGPARSRRPRAGAAARPTRCSVTPAPGTVPDRQVVVGSRSSVAAPGPRRRDRHLVPRAVLEDVLDEPPVAAGAALPAAARRRASATGPWTRTRSAPPAADQQREARQLRGGAPVSSARSVGIRAWPVGSGRWHSVEQFPDPLVAGRRQQRDHEQGVAVPVDQACARDAPAPAPSRSRRERADWRGGGHAHLPEAARARSSLTAARMRPRCVNACGKLPSASPDGPISSE